MYPITSVSDNLSSVKVPEGYTLSEEYKQQPQYEDNFTLKWDGEWQITYEVFRDLGLAFLFVLIIIYVLIVGWFQNFVTPLVQLSVIPLSMIGIVLGHWVMGAYFSMMLPAELDRQTYLAVAQKLNIQPKTAEKQIARFAKTGLINHFAHDKYRK